MLRSHICDVADEVLLACCKCGDSITEEIKLQHAVYCFGLQPSKAQIHEAVTSGEVTLPCSLATARALAEKLAGHCGSCGPWVPHARRGIQLHQLEALENAVISSGWLLKQCAAINAAEKNGFLLDENLYALDRLVLRPSTCGTPTQELQEMLRVIGSKRSPSAH
eukprot:6096350-Amphidinium_carterae.1